MMYSRAGTRIPARASDLALVPVGANSKNGQSYCNIFAQDNSRLHLGNNYYVTYSNLASHEYVQPLSSEISHSDHFAPTSQKRKRSASNCEDAMHRAGPRQTLAVVLDSLGEYSRSMQQLKDGDKGREMAAQLQVILTSLNQTAQDEMVSKDLDDQIQKLQLQLRGTRRIKINGALPRPLTSGVHTANTKSFCVTIGHWAISLTTKTMTSRASPYKTLLETCSTLRVQHSSRGSGISAFFGERDDIDQVTTLCPMVMAYNQVGNGSKVFKLAKSDSLDDLLRLLAIGEASIRDCDEEGRPLLLVSDLPIYSDAS